MPSPTSSEAAERVLLIGRAGCHLCDQAREVVAQVCADTGDRWREVSIDDEPDLAARFAEQIPVVMVDGEVHTYWRVEDRALRRALAGRWRWLPGRRS